jgi:hypothetical protein
LRREEGGAAATLAIFTIFVILCSVLALHTFEAGYSRQSGMIQRRMAIDTTRAVAAAVGTELNRALELAVEAGMYEAGRLGENKAAVEGLILEYFNARIEAGWFYSNFENIYVENIYAALDNSFWITWLPDGSLRARGHLNANFTHVAGPRAYGVGLDAGVVPRYGRMMHLAEYVLSQVQNMDSAAIPGFQESLNENYACEYLRFQLDIVDNQVRLTISDLYAGRAMAENR